MEAWASALSYAFCFMAVLLLPSVQMRSSSPVAHLCCGCCCRGHLPTIQPCRGGIPDLCAPLENAIRSGSSCIPSQSPPPLCPRLAGASPEGEDLPQPALSLSLCERLPLNSVWLSVESLILAIFRYLTKTPIIKRWEKYDLLWKLMLCKKSPFLRVLVACFATKSTFLHF